MYCIFCEISAGREPANIRYEDDEIIAFDNRLDWLPVMFLVLSKKHMTQQELWSSTLMTRIGKLAVDLGQQYCPGGFRLLSNFGYDAMQSQTHGHIHVLGGTHLGLYA